MKSAASDKRIWFNALINTSQEFSSNSYHVLSGFIQKNPNSRYVTEARQLRQKHLTKWHKEESVILATIYTNMMTGKKSFEVVTLKTAVNRYRDIPGGKTNHPAHKIASTIQELERGKKIDLSVEKISFYDELKKTLAKKECDKKRQLQESEANFSTSSESWWEKAKKVVSSFSEKCEKTAYNKIHQVELVPQFKRRSTWDTKRSIKDASGTSIPVTVSFYSSTSIEMKKEGKQLAKATFSFGSYDNLISYWIEQGTTGTLTFYSIYSDNEQLAKATYRIPTPYDLGFPRWRF